MPDQAQSTPGPSTSYRSSVLSPWSWDGWVVLHLGTASVLLWFSVILMLPAETFKSSMSYSFFESLAPEWAWSLLLGTGACIGFWGVGTSRPLVRYLSCTLLSLLHTLLALCFVFSNPVSTGSTTYSILALLALLRLVAGR